MMIGTGLGAPLILPERGIHRPEKFLHAVHDRDWKTPSHAQAKDMFGNECQTRFTVTARDKPHGRVLWRGWFDDFEDFDNFLWAMQSEVIRFDRYLQHLPDTERRFEDFHPGMLEEGWWWEYHQWHFLVGPQYPTTTSWSVPSNCKGISGKSGEFIDCIGGGGTGRRINASNQYMPGGGGGGASRITSLALTPGGSVQTQVGVGGASITSNSSSGSSNPGTSTWFNGTGLLAASVSAERGGDGTGSNIPGAVVVGPGGLAANATGTTKFSGGSGGTFSSAGSSGASGGGGSASTSANGSNAPNNSGPSSGSNGGNSGSGASGTAGVTGSGITSSNSPNGAEYDASHGTSAGTGGAYASSGSATSGAANTSGGYGGGTGGAFRSSTINNTTVGKAGDGLIVIVFEPPAAIPIFRRSTRFFTRKF